MSHDERSPLNELRAEVLVDYCKLILRKARCNMRPIKRACQAAVQKLGAVGHARQDVLGEPSADCSSRAELTSARLSKIFEKDSYGVQPHIAAE